MTWVPHVTVATVVENEGKFLFVEEWAEGRLCINQPAGHLEANETLIEAAARETLEETAWRVEIQGLLGSCLYPAPHKNISYYRTTFFASAIEHLSENTLDDGIERALWLSYDELLAEKNRLRSAMVISTVEQFLHGHKYPLSFIYGQ